MIARILLSVLIMSLARPVAAEVYQALPLQPVERFVLDNFGKALAPPTEAIIQGQRLRISRWLLPLDIGQATAIIEADMEILLGRGEEALDALQSVHGDVVVFAALSPVQIPGAPGGPRYARTLALHPQGLSTELVVTDDIDPLALAASPDLAWSLDGLPPQWSGVERAADGEVATLMFVYPAGATEIDSDREQQLRSKNFDILDITASGNGKMLSARNGHEIITVFSFADDDGSFVEIINYQNSVRAGAQ